MLSLAIVLIALGRPCAAEAAEPSPLRGAEESVSAPTDPPNRLAPRDGEGRQPATPSLRLDVPPIALAMAESAVTLRLPAPSRRDPPQDLRDG